MMEAIEIKKKKINLTNEMALTSARGFTVRKPNGTRVLLMIQPAWYLRMPASKLIQAEIILLSYAVILPKGIQWRLEGKDIPNPNQQTEKRKGGGPINTLNSQMLANSR